MTTCSAVIATHTNNDYHVVSNPLTIGVAVSELYPEVKVIVKYSNGKVLYDGKAIGQVVFSNRIPSDLYTVTLRNLSPGDIVATFYVSVDGVYKVVSTKIRLIDSLSRTTIVSSDAELQTELGYLKSANIPHAKIVLNPGTYIFPTGDDYNLLESSTLVSIEAKNFAEVVVKNVKTPNIKYAYFYGIGFSYPNNTAYSVIPSTFLVFEKCAFYSSVNGIIGSDASSVRVEDSAMSNLFIGMINVQTIRSISWSTVAGSVFQNCKVIDGCAGSRLLVSSDYSTDCAILSLSVATDGLLFRNVVCVDDYAKLLYSSENITNAIIQGVSHSTTDSNSIIAKYFDSVYMCNNSIISADKAMLLSVGASQSCVLNTWMALADATSLRIIAKTGIVSDVYATNSSDVRGVYKYPDSTTPFINNYLFLTSNSVLNSLSNTETSIKTIQGMGYTNQIGSMPYNSNPESYYRNMLTDADFGYVSANLS